MTASAYSMSSCAKARRLASGQISRGHLERLPVPGGDAGAQVVICGGQLDDGAAPVPLGRGADQQPRRDAVGDHPAGNGGVDGELVGHSTDGDLSPGLVDEVEHDAPGPVFARDGWIDVDQCRAVPQPREAARPASSTASRSSCAPCFAMRTQLAGVCPSWGGIHEQVVVEGRTIAALGRPVPSGATVVDAAGSTLLPG